MNTWGGAECHIGIPDEKGPATFAKFRMHSLRSKDSDTFNTSTMAGGNSRFIGAPALLLPVAASFAAAASATTLREKT